ncbi:MAG: alkaline phosphatase D family protein [Solirubrobacterales bacterium]|nr:alkaline phosphatase D family protein [Solirubrobacterales bacterium]
MAELVLGPLLRYVGENEATVWVETDAPCRVEVLEHSAETFSVCGHHYALVCVAGLEPGGRYPYEVALDGERAWPEPDSEFPEPVIRTVDPEAQLQILYGSCRVAAPHDPPYNLPKDEDPRGRDYDALYARALHMLAGDYESWPDLLVLLGDQVYADEVSPAVLDFIRSRRSTEEGPGEQVADFEEYTRLYYESWRDPVIRWLLSTVASSMIWDDHDMHDDWNISQSWCEDMRDLDWWEERIRGGISSYWIYQHIGNLSPDELAGNEQWQKVTEAGDATEYLRGFADHDGRNEAGRHWSIWRDLGRTRLVVIDSRGGRVVEPGKRSMVDEEEWGWIVEKVSGDFDHLLIGTSCPWLLATGIHHAETWNEALCDGAWGSRVAGWSETIRRAGDFDHWAGFRHSFEALGELIAEVGSGKYGMPPRSITVLAGDVHHAYVNQIGFRKGSGIRSAVHQAVCSPFRNPLNAKERALIKTTRSQPFIRSFRWLARRAGVPDPPFAWRLCEGPYFDNQVGTLFIDGERLEARLEKTVPDDAMQGRKPRLETSYERRLA